MLSWPTCSRGPSPPWVELCHQFMTNFKSAYTRPGNEVDLFAVQQ
jgi:hypothetical protein